MPQLEKGSKKLLNAWAFYDWANSVYSLVIATAVFPIFYTELFPEGQTHIAILGTSVKSTALISFVTAFAFLLVAFISPLLSGIADYSGNKKIFLKLFCYLGALSCIGLYWFSLENIYWSLVCYFFGLVGFWGSLVFYNSYLPDIAFPDQQDRISAKGYSLGYIGSVLLLIFNLAMVMFPGSFGLKEIEGLEHPSVRAMRISFVSVGVWWILFSQYTYYYLPKGTRKNKVTHHVLLNGFKELRKVWGELKLNLTLKRYLGAFFVYSMAVQTVMLVATYFGAEEIAWGEGEKQTGLIVSILLIQLVAVAGAVATSRLSEKYGNIKTLIGINIIWAIICICAFFLTLPIHFYITAGFVGLVMGGIQSLSRSTYSKFLPETKDTASFFSFYDVTEKIGIVIGMLLYGAIDQIFGSMRYSIVFLTLFFIIGIFLLRRVLKKS
ncbi:MFS transporter [Flavobacterium salilacus subsp. salilacus]|uniref:MFS transporter n=1 Tax=Flavobacterium TaxID=237 RepID=UPI00107535A9|nr:MULTISPECIES: MFS transporter [Flavobacterium]KAF2517552.1 MFS transporter [Flavobacterium salilacus subsp. salilacus]MBE1615701.1 MFS transporter [Flavobacterium sp. SaA2.13]